MDSKKKWFFFMLSICLCISVTGCFGRENNSVTDDKDQNDVSPAESPKTVDKDTRIKEIEDDAKKDATDDDNIDKDDIHEAVSYIDKHMDDPFKSDEVEEKLIYYGAYLKHVGNRKTEGSKHDLAMLGDNVHKYVSNVYTDAEDKMSDISKGLKNSIDKTMDTLKDTKDKAVDEFYNIVK